MNRTRVPGPEWTPTSVPGRRLLVSGLVAMACLFAPASGRAQMCNPFTEPSRVSEATPTAKWTQTFCDGNIAGTDACGGTTGKVEFFLDLESMDDVDLNCTTDNGTICVFDSSCTQMLAGGSGDSLRLSGPLPGASLRIIVSDDAVGTLCDQAMDPNVTCTGSFGGRIVIDTDFERPLEAQGWSLDQCPGCVPVLASLSAGSWFYAEPVSVPASGGEQLALLEMSDSIDAQLYLARWDGERWQRVASGVAFGTLRVISWHAPEGSYRWQVEARRGEGKATLWISRPNGGSDE